MAKGQVIGMLLPHPTAVLQSHISVGEVLGLRASSPHASLDPQAADKTRCGDEGVKQEKYSLHDLYLDHVERRYHERIRHILMPFASMLDGVIGEISTSTQHIDLNEGARAEIAAAIPALSPKPAKAEQEKVDWMLEKGGIEPDPSPGASPWF